MNTHSDCPLIENTSLSRSTRFPIALSLLIFASCGKLPENTQTSLSSNLQKKSESSVDSSILDPSASPAGTAGILDEVESTSTTSPSWPTNSELDTSDTGDLTDIGDLDDSNATTSDSSSSETDSGDESEAISLTSLIIQPENPILHLDLNTSGSQSFSAIGHFSDGSEKNLSNEVQWKINDSELGDISTSTLVIPPSSTTSVYSALVTAILGSDREARATTRITVAKYQKSGSKPDILLVLPYLDPRGPQQRSLRFQTSIRNLDIFFALDTTASMGGEIAQLQEDLSRQILPEIRSHIPNSHFGLGAIQDFPVDSYGAPGDQPFRLVHAISPDLQRIQSAVYDLHLGNGYDHPEAIIESLYQIASGEGISAPIPTMVAKHQDGRGGVSFRPLSLPVIVPITDTISHAPGESHCPNVNYEGQTAIHAHTRTQSIEALAGICAKVLTIASSKQSSSTCSARSEGEQLARATGSRVHPAIWNRSPRPMECKPGQCCTGIDGIGHAPDSDGMCPLVFDIDPTGTGLGSSIVAGLQALVDYSPFDVQAAFHGSTTDFSGMPLAPGHSTTDFFKTLLANQHSAPPLPGLPKPRIKRETFEGVVPGMIVEFTFSAYNDVVKATTEPQMFQATIQIHADRCTEILLDERTITVLVPALTPSPN